MNIMMIENLTKSYGEKTLFKDISFSINDGDKIGIIGINGVGKSTLLKIIYGIDIADSGSVNMPSKTRIEFLSQDPNFDPKATVLEQIFKGDSPIMKLIQRYELALEKLENNPENKEFQEKILSLNNEMTAQDAWETENRAKTILTKLGIKHFDSKMNTLSGGQQKRVALAAALIAPCELLILDEPTNHMDNNTIDWIEEYLTSRKGALLMITHDRYFLDRVVNKTLELEKGNLYTYPGNYSYFIEKRLERREIANSIEKKRKNLYKKELEWIRSGCQARTTKSKSRIQRFEIIKNSKVDLTQEVLDISLGQSRLGKKIVSIKNLSKSFDNKKIIDNFSYTVLKNDRIGIIGDNGIGKSTLLNIIKGVLNPDSGSIDIGSTVKIGYFSQKTTHMDESLRAIDYIKEHSEIFEMSDGSKISASQIMEQFLFTPDMQWTYINRLSGGEKRRLYLLKILVAAPNVLLLDEPTNDLDIDSLKVLESYIDNFEGPVISVSHDRYFLNRTCSRIFSYEGSGKILEHTGNYTDFRNFKKSIIPDVLVKNNNKENTSKKPKKQAQLKLTYKENLEFQSIESEIESLEALLDKLENDMNNNSRDFVKLNELLKEKELVEEKLLDKMERFEYLNDIYYKRI